MHFGRVADVVVGVASLHLVQLDKGALELILHLLNFTIVMDHTQRVVYSVVRCFHVSVRKARITIWAALIVLQTLLKDGRILHGALVLHSKYSRTRILRLLLHRCRDDHSVLTSHTRRQTGIKLGMFVP